MNTEHTIRRGFRSDVNAQLDEIINVIKQVKDKHGVDIRFDNTQSNKYSLTMNGTTYVFNLYRDVLAALHMLLNI